MCDDAAEAVRCPLRRVTVAGLAGDGSPPFLLVADDVVVGFFAVNGGALGEETGNVYYHAADSLAWETLGAGYTDYRWPGWQAEVQALGADEAFSLYPPPCTAGPPYGERHRGVVPLDELYRLYVDAGR